MPPPVIPKPEFSPYGLYAIDVRQRPLPGSTPFHNSEHYTDECSMSDVPIGSISRFNNRDWALTRGYVECQYCRAE